jgi:hypothetical protein
MYKIVRVKYVDGNQYHPRHKIVSSAETLEQALEKIEDIATQYIIKKIKPSFITETEINKKVSCETKYTMNRNKHNNNIIEIHEKKTITEIKPGLVYGSTDKVRKESYQIGYFCYVKDESVTPQTCDNCLMSINRPVPMKVISGANPDLVKQLRSNGLFKKCQQSTAHNQMAIEENLHEYESMDDESLTE